MPPSSCVATTSAASHQRGSTPSMAGGRVLGALLPQHMHGQRCRPHATASRNQQHTRAGYCRRCAPPPPAMYTQPAGCFLDRAVCMACSKAHKSCMPPQPTGARAPGGAQRVPFIPRSVCTHDTTQQQLVQLQQKTTAEAQPQTQPCNPGNPSAYRAVSRAGTTTGCRSAVHMVGTRLQWLQQGQVWVGTLHRRLVEHCQQQVLTPDAGIPW